MGFYQPFFGNIIGISQDIDSQLYMIYGFSMEIAVNMRMFDDLVRKKASQYVWHRGFMGESTNPQPDDQRRIYDWGLFKLGKLGFEHGRIRSWDDLTNKKDHSSAKKPTMKSIYLDLPKKDHKDNRSTVSGFEHEENGSLLTMELQQLTRIHKEIGIIYDLTTKHVRFRQVYVELCRDLSRSTGPLFHPLP